MKTHIMDANSESGYREATSIELDALAYIESMKEHIITDGEVALMATNNCDVLHYLHKMIRIV